MNSRINHLPTESIVPTAYTTKESPVNRFFIALLTALLIALSALNATPAFAQNATPSDVDAADQAYLQEYNQRAVEKYKAMKATQAAKNAAAAASAVPDYGGEMFVREYEQRARDIYAAVQKPSAPVVVNSVPDWGGELFLAEYEQRASERYQQWLAQQNGRLTGTTSR